MTKPSIIKFLITVIETSPRVTPQPVSPAPPGKTGLTSLQPAANCLPGLQLKIPNIGAGFRLYIKKLQQLSPHTHPCSQSNILEEGVVDVPMSSASSPQT